ncbi:MAG: DNA repair protein RecO [Phycisphaerales bacterium]
MPPIADTAVCVRSWDWSETSQTLTLMTRAHGLVRCLAKGSKRQTPSAAFSGGVELLSVAEVQLHLRPTAELGLLTRWDLTEVFTRLRHDLAAHRAALYASELVQALCAERDPHPQTFDALIGCLRSIGAGGATLPALAVYQWSALSEAGFEPQLDALVTGVPLPKAPGLLFDPVLGGFTRVADALPVQAPGVDWRVRSTTIEHLRALKRGDSPLTTESATAAERSARFLAAYARHIVQRELRTLALVFPDLATHN